MFFAVETPMISEKKWKEQPVIGLIRAHSFRHPPFFFTVWEQTVSFDRFSSIIQTFNDTRIAYTLKCPFDL